MALKINWSALPVEYLYVTQGCNGNVWASTTPPRRPSDASSQRWVLLPANSKGKSFLWYKTKTQRDWATAVYQRPSEERALHSDEMKMYAEDAAVCREPWLLWQSKPVEGSVWSDLGTHPAWAEEREYRRKPLTAQPFVFPHLFVNKANKEKPYLVKVANSDFTHISTGWMDDPRLPESEEVLQPSVDIELSSDEFATLPEAVQFIANWWRRNSTPQS